MLVRNEVVDEDVSVVVMLGLDAALLDVHVFGLWPEDRDRTIQWRGGTGCTLALVRSRAWLARLGAGIGVRELVGVGDDAAGAGAAGRRGAAARSIQGCDAT